jgi:predicted O-methyltransferase YrrM
MAAFSESFAREDIFMQQARTNGLEVAAVDPSPAVGGFLKFLVHQIQAKSIVEIGTGSGVSGLWIFQGMAKDAVFTSIDTERELTGNARKIFDEAGIASQRYRLITGNIIDVVHKLADSNYDLLVVRLSNDLFDVVQESYRLLKPNGTLVLDEVLSGGRVADPTQRDFETISRRDVVRAMKDDARWNSTLLPVGNGLLVSTKI